MASDDILICVFPESRAMVFNSVNAERDRQEAKWGSQSWDNGTTEDYRWIADAYRDNCEAAFKAGELTWHDILLEEVFEAMGEEDVDRLEMELVQAIAVAVNWIEDIRRKRNERAANHG